jgi:hypothetical protein
VRKFEIDRRPRGSAVQALLRRQRRVDFDHVRDLELAREFRTGEGAECVALVDQVDGAGRLGRGEPLAEPVLVGFVEGDDFGAGGRERSTHRLDVDARTLLLLRGHARIRVQVHDLHETKTRPTAASNQRFSVSALRRASKRRVT